MRLLDRRELPGFASYLLPRTRAALERGDMAVTAVGAVCGLLNGAIVAVAKVPSLVVTLGTLYAFRGLDSLWASSSDRLQINAADLP